MHSPFFLSSAYLANLLTAPTRWQAAAHSLDGASCSVPGGGSGEDSTQGNWVADKSFENLVGNKFN